MRSLAKAVGVPRTLTALSSRGQTETWYKRPKSAQ